MIVCGDVINFNGSWFKIKVVNNDDDFLSYSYFLKNCYLFPLFKMLLDSLLKFSLKKSFVFAYLFHVHM